MAGPTDPRAPPTPAWRPRGTVPGGAPGVPGGSPGSLGHAPGDGDFARLLEAASSPRAHRLTVSPEIEAWGATRVPRGAPTAGSLGAVRDRALGRRGPDAARVGAADRDASSDPGRDVAFGASRGVAVDPAQRPPAPDAGTPGRPVRRLRDRVTLGLFALAALWILLNVLDLFGRSGGEDLGPLLVLAVVAFFVLRGWMRPRRPPTDSR